ncbi:MAG: hypothetical protein ACRDSJ_02400 [Rubrobacteraceae bacterium]
MQQSTRFLTYKGTSWRLLHSLWIGWTFTLGFFSWLAFAYIGIRTRHSRWTLWAILYSAPLIVFAIFSSAPQIWITDVALTITVMLGIFSIIHAFWIRKEYLLRLEMRQNQISSVSATSRGKRWEWLHSLWMLWTLTFGLSSWIAFLYIGIRTQRARWIMWGILYFAIFLLFAVSEPIFGQQSEITEALTGLLIVSGIVSIVHAFSVRSDYLMELENRLGEEFGDKKISYQPETEQTIQSESTSSKQRNEQPESPEGPVTATDLTEDKPVEGHSTSPHTGTISTPSARKATETGPTRISEVLTASSPSSISETYPLPLAYSWSLLASLWDPRDRYREQLRHAENMLAFLGSVSLALLEGHDYAEADIDPKIPWQGGISFGSWKLVIQRSARVLRKKDHSLASAICRLNIGSEKKGFGADIAHLISVRNDYHHGRGPLIEEEIVKASNEAQERLQRCMEAVSFLTQYPVRLVQDFDVDRHNDGFSLKCLRLMGDGPGFSQEKVDFPRALPRGDLVLDMGNGEWLSLYPFIIASNCPRCRYRETYFVDRWNDRKGIVVMKSFERGHPEDRGDVSDSLARLI